MTASFYPKPEPPVQPPGSPASPADSARPSRPGWKQAQTRARAQFLILLAAWGALTLARDLLGLMAPASPATASAEEPAPIALARCEGRLAEARAQSSQATGDPVFYRRVTSLELRRAELLALATYKARHGPDWQQLWRTMPDPGAWRADFLRGDPEGCLSRASEAAREAARLEKRPERRQQALELLATTRAALGDTPGEAAALEAAAVCPPESARLWLRLADAYGRARRFTRAEAARTRALALMEAETPSR